MGLIPGSGRSPGEGHGKPLQYSCLENLHGQRSLAGHSPWGCRESDTTEAVITHPTSWQNQSYRMPAQSCQAERRQQTLARGSPSRLLCVVICHDVPLWAPL